MTTVKLTPERIRDLEQRLASAGFEFSALEHGHFRARGPGVVVSAYHSGRVVAQGRQAERLLEELGLLDPTLDGPVVGSDESGKGDYFGPLVVAAVRVGPEHERALTRLGVRDCKRMGDGAILRAAAGIRRLCPHAVRALAPQEYNAAHEKEGNVALFLSRMHADAIAEAARGAAGRVKVVIDQFTFHDRLAAELRRAGVECELEIRPRAEDNPAVAAASVLARSEFLIGLRELGNIFGTHLPKGAGHAAEQAARRLFRAGGKAALAEVAKLHFKTTKRVTEELF